MQVSALDRLYSTKLEPLDPPYPYTDIATYDADEALCKEVYDYVADHPDDAWAKADAIRDRDARDKRIREVVVASAKKMDPQWLQDKLSTIRDPKIASRAAGKVGNKKTELKKKLAETHDPYIKAKRELTEKLVAEVAAFCEQSLIQDAVLSASLIRDKKERLNCLKKIYHLEAKATYNQPETTEEKADAVVKEFIACVTEKSEKKVTEETKQKEDNFVKRLCIRSAALGRTDLACALAQKGFELRIIGHATRLNILEKVSIISAVWSEDELNKVRMQDGINSSRRMQLQIEARTAAIFAD